MIKQVQQKLIALGYDLGPSGADGDAGRYTIAAVAKFQADRGLAIKYPGTIGSKTLAALSIEETVKSRAPWAVEAIKLLGLHEVKNAKTLDKLLRMDTSEIAWCGAGVGYCISATLPTEPLPSNPLGARNWMKFGREVNICLDAVAVFWRGSKTGWQGHVGFVAGHDKTAVHCLGFNQSNSVSITRIAKNRILGYRWPINFELPTDELAMTTIGGTLSQNEA